MRFKGGVAMFHGGVLRSADVDRQVVNRRFCLHDVGGHFFVFFIKKSIILLCLSLMICFK